MFDYDDRDLQRCNSDSTIEDLLNALKDTPASRCLVAAHPFGSVYIRRDANGHWQHTRPARTASGSTRWMNESRIYSHRLYTLLAESEVSPVSITEYPHSVDYEAERRLVNA